MILKATGADTQPVSNWLWFGVLAPGASWFTHLVVTYMMAPLACELGGPILLVGISVLMAAMTTSAGLVSWSLWRQLAQAERASVMQRMEGSRVAFLVFAGLLGSGVFLLAIILATIPVFFIDPCSPLTPMPHGH